MVHVCFVLVIVRSLHICLHASLSHTRCRPSIRQHYLFYPQSHWTLSPLSPPPPSSPTSHHHQPSPPIAPPTAQARTSFSKRSLTCLQETSSITINHNDTKNNTGTIYRRRGGDGGSTPSPHASHTAHPPPTHSPSPTITSLAPPTHTPSATDTHTRTRPCRPPVLAVGTRGGARVAWDGSPDDTSRAEECGEHAEWDVHTRRRRDGA